MAVKASQQTAPRPAPATADGAPAEMVRWTRTKAVTTEAITWAGRATGMRLPMSWSLMPVSACHCGTKNGGEYQMAPRRKLATMAAVNAAQFIAEACMALPPHRVLCPDKISAFFPGQADARRL